MVGGNENNINFAVGHLFYLDTRISKRTKYLLNLRLKNLYLSILDFVKFRLAVVS